MNKMSLSLAFLAFLACGIAACNNECDYFEKCDGTHRLICGDGPDQVVNRKEHSIACVAPNEACVEIDKNHTACVLPSRTVCAESSVRCEDQVLIQCTPPLNYTNAPEPPQFEQATDCAATGGVCMAMGTSFACVGGM